jgi:outer membrane autotransporter protein
MDLQRLQSRSSFVVARQSSVVRAAFLMGICTAAAVISAVDTAQAQQGAFVYATRGNEDAVSVIDTITDTVPTTYAVGVSPVAVAVRGDQSLIYVSNQNGNTISVISTLTNAVVATIPVAQPYGIGLNPAGTRLYVPSFGGTTVSVVDTTSNTVVGIIPVGNSPTTAAVTPDGSRVYVTNSSSNTVSVIDAATNTVVGSIAVGNAPVGAAVTPDGTRVYVSNHGSSDVYVISTSTNAVVAVIPLAGDDTLAISPDGKRVYAVAGNGFNVIDVATNAVIASVPVAGSNNVVGIAVSPDGSRLYLANASGTDVSVVDTATYALIGTVPLGGSPFLLGVCSNGNALLGAGATFAAGTGGALACTQASGPTGSAGPVFTGGTLLIAGANVSSNLPISLQAQGGIINTNGNNATLSGAISGPGGLSKIGAGTLTLSGQSTYTGATGVNAGTLQAGAVNAFSPFSAFTVASGATLALASFNQTIGSLAGTGSVTLGSATLTTGNDNTSTVFSGTISGAGGLTKIGSGMLLLAGANSYAGPTNINAGILNVNGSLASTVSVNAGGTLMGNGTIGGLSVSSAGTIAPGNSIGTLTVAGNASFAPGSIYQVEANAAGQSDKIVAGGAAALNGGSVQVLAQNGTYARKTTYTILTASGGVSGTFAGVTSNFAFLTPTLTYDANDVFLNLFQSAFAAGAQTPNQYAVGTTLDRANASATGDFSSVLDALSVLSNTQGPAALNAISGQPYADFGTMNTNNAALFMNTLGQQMANARGTASTGQRQTLAQACEIETCDAVGPLSAWASALGGLGSVLGDTNASALTYNFGGAAAGIDYRLDPRFLVGLGVGYTHGTQWVNTFMGQGWSDSVSVAAYGSFTQSGFYLDALAGYAYSNNQLQRQILIPGLQQRTATGSTGANQFLGQAEAGYKVDIYAPAAASITPFGRFQISSVTQNAFSEGGAQSLSLNVAQQTTNSQRTTIGADLGSSVGLGGERKLDLAVRLGWQHEFANTGRPITAAFAGAPGNALTVFGATPARDSAALGLQATTTIAAATQVYLRYDGGVGGGTDNHALIAGLRMSW